MLVAFAVWGKGLLGQLSKTFSAAAAAVGIVASLTIDMNVFKLGSRCSRESGCPLVVLLAAQAH